MSTDLIARTSYRLTTPTVHEHAHTLDDFDPTWGRFPGMVPTALLEPARAPPPVSVLRQMQAEIQAASEPCTIAEAATVAGMVIAAHPTRDATSPTYAQLLAKELHRLPRDQLGRVFDRIIATSLEFRPTIGAVRVAVDHQLSKRRLLAMRIEAALRYWQHQAEERRRQAEPTVKIDAPALRRIPRPPASPSHRPETEAPKRPKMRPLSPEQLAVLRLRPPAKSQE